MNEQLVLIVIGAVVAGFILRPLLRGKDNRTNAKPVVPAPAVAGSEELSELELDRAMGRVSDEDYARWRHELEAVPPTEAPTAAPPSTDAPAAVPPSTDAPAAVPPPSDAPSRAESLVRHWREMPRPVCPRCGVRPEPAARFCSNCGASLAP